jgi:aspartyl-tRNA synthetase
MARHADVARALSDHETYCSGAGVGLSDFRKEPPWRVPSLLLEADPPPHSGVRKPMLRLMSPKVTESLRDRFTAAAEEIVDTLVDRGAFDGVTDLAEIYPVRVFADALGRGGVVRGFRVPAATADLPRRRLDELTEQAREFGAGGLVWAVAEEGGRWRSPVAKFLTEDEMGAAVAALGAGTGDTLLIVADSAATAAHVLGELRLAVAPEPAGHDLLWVVDFPMFEWSEAERRWDPLHHPFTAPLAPGRGVETTAADLDTDPGSWRSRAYDVVMDGLEIGGGSIRINRPDVQSRVFDALGLAPEEAERRFGFLLEALRYGAPPHGGIAFGLDRIVALLAMRDSIRETIAFPKTASGADPMTGAPAPVDAAQLRELGIQAAPAPRAQPA